MVLILSTDGDYSTDIVIDWLVYKNFPFLRINDNDIINKEFNISLENGKINFKLNNKSIELDTIKAVWFRKFGFFNFSNVAEYFKENSSKENEKKSSHLAFEYRKVLDLLITLLQEKKWLCTPKYARLNKFEVLIEAAKINIKIPYSLICNNTEVLQNLLLKKEKIITKPLSEGTMFKGENNKTYTTLTSSFSKDDINNISGFFFPSLVQEEIEKDYEIRSFYLLGKFYSMAIFSQSNEKTKTDFRDYDFINPNRLMPYKLPLLVEKKLNRLMRKLKLNTGSIDLIKSIDNQYIFLEVNPSGQFGMVEDACNYNLHELVATSLIELSK